MLISIKDLHGYHLSGIDGEIGTVKDLYFDDQFWTIRYLVCRLLLEKKKKTLSHNPTNRNTNLVKIDTISESVTNSVIIAIRDNPGRQ